MLQREQAYPDSGPHLNLSRIRWGAHVPQVSRAQRPIGHRPIGPRSTEPIGPMSAHRILWEHHWDPMGIHAGIPVERRPIMSINLAWTDVLLTALQIFQERSQEADNAICSGEPLTL